MSMPQLGRLEPVDLRTVWNNEATDFTPWLAREDNLAMLGETIGLELELTSVEEGVGPFRADIVCKDTATDTIVLIENQLERTDHNHLGQLLTYAAGLDAVSIVWIADRFTEEHRAALDWLNDLTPNDVNFFGLEIELWRIDRSPIAPKFNMVSKPNEWIKTGGGRGGGRTPLEQEQIAYWSGLAKLFEEGDSRLRMRAPRASHGMRFAIGRSGFRLEAFRNSRDNRIGVMLVIDNDEASTYYWLLEEEKAAIEASVGEPLEWLEKPDRKRQQIALRWDGVDPSNRKHWLEQHKWLKAKLDCFYEVFAPLVSELDAADYAEAEDDGLAD